ncbi:MAG: hypothetical protein FWC94_06820 [Bacteroidales bacterium]|nr:hypothetical protein [Bacteroidales bacterium]
MKLNKANRYIKTKIILLQIFFFILLLCVKFISRILNDVGEVDYLLYLHSNIEIVFGGLLLLGLSFGICRYILKSDKMLTTFFWITLSMYFLFLVFEYVEAVLFLPLYNAPMISHHLLSLVATFVYMCVLYVICLFWRKKSPLA